MTDLRPYQETAVVGAESVALDGAGLHWGMGYHTRANTEPCLLATRGSPRQLSAERPGPGHTCPDRSEMTRYPQDRASVLVTTLISIVLRHLRAPEVHAEIAQTLREEFPRHGAPSARRDPPQR